LKFNAGRNVPTGNANTAARLRKPTGGLVFSALKWPLPGAFQVLHGGISGPRNLLW